MKDEQNKGTPWAVGVIENPAAVVIGKTMILSEQGLSLYLEVMKGEGADVAAVENLSKAYYQAKENESPNADAPANHPVSAPEGVIGASRFPLKATANPTLVKGGAANLPYREPSKVPEYIEKIVRGKALKPREIVEKLRTDYGEKVLQGSMPYFLKQSIEKYGVIKLGVGMYGAPARSEGE